MGLNAEQLPGKEQLSGLTEYMRNMFKRGKSMTPKLVLRLNEIDNT